jgi:hypothetical protein
MLEIEVIVPVTVGCVVSVVLLLFRIPTRVSTTKIVFAPRFVIAESRDEYQSEGATVVVGVVPKIRATSVADGVAPSV